MTSRRDFLRQSACGFGSIALAALARGASPLAVKPGHFAARARAVIFLWMQGGPSQMDLFDFKPRLKAEAGKPLPFKLPKNYQAPGIDATRLFGPISEFRPRGKSGIEISDLLPHLSGVADELCILRAMQADSEAHAPAVRQLHTGHSTQPRPSIGSWITYGLGTENQNLPGFVTLCPNLSGDQGSTQLFSSSFLPAIFQGTTIGESGKAAEASIRYLSEGEGPPGAQRLQLGLVREMNRHYQTVSRNDPAMEGMIESFELAFRMQSAAPPVLDLAKESKATLALYGIGDKETDNFGRQCLMARRMVESGVRFVQVTDSGWDHHGKLMSGLPARCKAVDKPISGLIRDLRSRGLLDSTVLWWSGEFGRTPFDQDLTQGKAPAEERGREHNPRGFTGWLAGGGVKGGVAFGATDDYSWEAVEGKVHMHDLHATLLHLLGLDHEKLTYRYTGRDYRLTDVYGRVVREILA